MELINREDIMYTDLFAEMTGIPVKTVAKVSIDDMPTYTIDDLRPQAHWDLADDGTGQFYRRFSDEAGCAAPVVLDGIGGSISFRDIVLWFFVGRADVPSERNDAEKMAVWLHGSCFCSIFPTGKPFCCP